MGTSHRKFFFDNGEFQLLMFKEHRTLLACIYHILMLVPPNPAENVTMVKPSVQPLGDNAACVCYVRLNQQIDK